MKKRIIYIMYKCENTGISFVMLNEKKAYTKMCILVHGYGSNCEDLAEFFSEYAARRDDTLFVFPNGVDKFEGDADDNRARQWFSLAVRMDEIFIQALSKIQDDIVEFIYARLSASNLKMSDLIFGGFSQGAMLSMYLGLRMNEAPRAICSFSGYMIDPARLCETMNPDCAKYTDVFLSHGADDDVIPQEASRNAEMMCRRAQLNCATSFQENVGHYISGKALEDFDAFISKIG